MNPTFDVISSLRFWIFWILLSFNSFCLLSWEIWEATGLLFPQLLRDFQVNPAQVGLASRHVLDVLGFGCSGDILCPQAIVILKAMAHQSLLMLALLKLRQPHRSPWAMLVALFWVAALGWDAGRWCSQDWWWRLAPRSCCWLHQGDGCHDCHDCHDG